jgi:hypothetical protein
MSEDKEFVSLGDIETETEVTETTAPAKRERTAGERAATAARVALWRSRQTKSEAKDLVLSEKQSEKIQRNTAVQFAVALSKLSPEQRLSLEGTEDLMSLGDINSMMFEVVVLCDIELFKNCEAEAVKEFYDEFVERHPYARDLVLPRAWYADRERNHFEWYIERFLYSIKADPAPGRLRGKILVDFDPDGPVQFELDQFFSAVKKDKKWQSRTPDALAELLEEPAKRPRGRPRKSPAEEKPNLEAIAEQAAQRERHHAAVRARDYSTPPTELQADHWAAHHAAESAKALTSALAHDQEEAEPSRP